MTEFYEQVKERLMRYVRINTESNPHSTSVPTTSCQHDLASVIYEELQKIGATNVYYDKDTCVVYGSLEANVKSGRAIGFVTHMDTAPDASGKDVKPWVLENYDGNDIVLNKEKKHYYVTICISKSETIYWAGFDFNAWYNTTWRG
ncbi:MAG: hypothetical protein ACLTTH_07985 [Holdemanella porci]